MTEPSPRPAESAAPGGKQERLLLAAAAIIAAEGAEALSIRRLAGEVGASTMAVYTWYGSKPNLLRAVFREAFLRFGECLRAVAPTGDPLADLLRLGRAYRDYARAQPNLYEVMFGRRIAQSEADAEDLEMAAQTFTVLVDCVARCVEEGALSCPPVEGAWQIWAGVHGAMSLELLDNRPPEGTPPDADSRLAALTRTLLAGLGADRRRLDEAIAGLP